MSILYLQEQQKKFCILQKVEFQSSKFEWQTCFVRYLYNTWDQYCKFVLFVLISRVIKISHKASLSFKFRWLEFCKMQNLFCCSCSYKIHMYRMWQKPTNRQSKTLTILTQFSKQMRECIVNLSALNLPRSAPLRKLQKSKPHYNWKMYTAAQVSWRSILMSLSLVVHQKRWRQTWTLHTIRSLNQNQNQMHPSLISRTSPWYATLYRSKHIWILITAPLFQFCFLKRMSPSTRRIVGPMMQQVLYL